MEVDVATGRWIISKSRLTKETNKEILNNKFRRCLTIETSETLIPRANTPLQFLIMKKDRSLSLKVYG